MSNHTPPIVPHVLYVADQSHPWKLAPIERLQTKYHTPTTVALEFGTIGDVKPIKGKSGVTKQQYHVWCVPDEAAWQRIERARADLQLAIDRFAGELRRLGSYATRLAEAGGVKTAPNPLSPTVISVDDPDSTDTHYFIGNPVPRISRSEISAHTPKMLNTVRDGKPWSTTHQRDHFVCPSDDHWRMIETRQQDAQTAYEAWQKLLRELGTYQAALGDGRYAALQAPQPAAPAKFPELVGPWFYGFHRNNTSKTLAHTWRSDPSRSAKIRFVSACGMAMQHEEPQRIEDLSTPGLALCAQCHQFRTVTRAKPAALSPAAIKRGLVVTRDRQATDLDDALHAQLVAARYTWQTATFTPDGRWHHLIGWHDAALARVEQIRLRRERIVALLATAALAPAAPVAVGVAMMDAAEARETLDAMRQDLGQAEISLGSFRQRALEFAELGEQYSKSYVSRLLNAAKIERLLELPVGNSEVPERTLRPLGQLDTPEQQRQAWQVASTAAGGATPTAGQVQAAVDARKAEQLAQADAQHLQAIEKIIATLDQWADSARPAQIQEAYSHAREIRDTALHARAFATIDRALDNTAAPAPEQRGQPKAPVPEQLPWPLPKELADRATRTGLLVYKETRSYRTMNAKGAANYAYHKSVGELEGYIRSQEIRSYADQQAKREPPAAAPVVSLPADFADAQRRARAIGLNLAMNMYGKFSCKNERGSGVDQYDWPDMLQHLVYAERSHAEREAERARRQQPAAALTAVPDMVQPAIGVRRPQRPASADVSATLRYLDQIESYADQQEQRVAELERRLAAPIRWIRVQLATCRLRIADGTADDITAAELETLADELEQLVSDGSVAVDIAESLARQIGEAQQDLRGKVKSA